MHLKVYATISVYYSETYIIINFRWLWHGLHVETLHRERDGILVETHGLYVPVRELSLSVASWEVGGEAVSRSCWR